MRFQKLKQNRICYQVADQIKEAIESGAIKVGDKLPPERELVNQLGISRKTLSEALRLLEQEGLIQIKTGAKGGAFVRNLTTEQVSESLALLIRFNKISLYELTEFRKDVEGIIASRAAQRATAEEVSYLKSLLSETDEIFKNDEFNWKAFMQVDKRMHITLACASRNAIYESVLRSIHDNIHRYYESYLPKDKEFLQSTNYKEMIEIVKAIEEKDSEKASSLIQEHVQRGSNYMESLASKDNGHVT